MGKYSGKSIVVIATWMASIAERYCDCVGKERDNTLGLLY